MMNPKKGLRDQESPLRALWQGIRDAGEADAAHEGHSSRGITEQKGEGRRVSQLSHFKQRETRPLSSSIELHLFTNRVCKKKNRGSNKAIPPCPEIGSMMT